MVAGFETFVDGSVQVCNILIESMNILNSQIYAFKFERFSSWKHLSLKDFPIGSI